MPRKSARPHVDRKRAKNACSRNEMCTMNDQTIKSYTWSSSVAAASSKYLSIIIIVMVVEMMMMMLMGPLYPSFYDFTYITMDRNNSIQLILTIDCDLQLNVRTSLPHLCVFLIINNAVLNTSLSADVGQPVSNQTYPWLMKLGIAHFVLGVYWRIVMYASLS